MSSPRLTCIALAAAAAAATAPAHAIDSTLDFAGPICGAAGDAACSDYAQIGQNYGDIAGVLDVGYRSAAVATGVTYEPFLKSWSTGYSGLESVAWGGADAGAYYSEISFTPAAGSAVTLKSFDFGDYLDRNYGSSATIVDTAGNVLWSSGAFNPGTTPTSFAPMVSSSSTLLLRWGPDGYDVGIDNIALSVSAVPEPASAALLLAGAGLLVALQRRRRR